MSYEAKVLDYVVKFSLGIGRSIPDLAREAWQRRNVVFLARGVEIYIK